MSSLQKIFFFFSIFFISLAIPVVALADDACEGHYTNSSGQTIIQEGTCAYANTSRNAPDCTTYFSSDPNYHSIKDDIVSCHFNNFSAYSCCAKNTGSPSPGSECDGYTSDNKANVQRGSCIYYLTSGNPPYTTDENADGVCIAANSCQRVSCSTLTQATFGDSNYHSIDDSVTHCPIGSLGMEAGGMYQCCAPDNQPSPVAPPPPCITGPDGSCHQIDTGLGMIQVDPSSIVGSLFRVILGISGGIAVVLVIISGYRLMFSRGDPEKLKGAQEMLVSAIIGLLFIIFSIVIIEIIGVDILHLPGLNR